MSQLPPEAVNQLSANVAGYIADQRTRFFVRAQPLSASQQLRLASFFRDDLLATLRTVELAGERLANPDFYPALAALGFSNLPDFSLMAAITFQDVVVARESLVDSTKGAHGLLFHELVHVEQYRQLGVSHFAELYVRGFLSGGGYDGIPLEINAYELGARFEAHPAQPFSVENEVASWIRNGRFWQNF